MTTMKTEKHQMQKEIWTQRIREQKVSGLPVRKWCNENGFPESMYYYWLRVIRQETLIKAGTLVVSGKQDFVELKPVHNLSSALSSDISAKIKANGIEIDIYEGISPALIKTIIISVK